MTGAVDSLELDPSNDDDLHSPCSKYSHEIKGLILRVPLIVREFFL